MNHTLKDFYSYLNSKNAEKSEFLKVYSHTVKTKYGDLHVSIDERDFNKNGIPYKRTKLFSIFCCFDDFEKSKGFLEEYFDYLRIYTGKWNFHNEFWNETLKRFMFELNKIT